MSKAVIEIIQYCLKAGRDPVEALLDYYHEKDSYPTRREVARIVERVRLFGLDTRPSLGVR